MDERTKRMIAEYIPGPPDPTLEPNEFYYKQETIGGERIIRVFALDVLPHENDVEYGIYQQKGGRLVRVDSGCGNPFRGVKRGALYDNKQDCRDQTHWFYDHWEALREAQRREETQC